MIAQWTCGEKMFMLRATGGKGFEPGSCNCCSRDKCALVAFAHFLTPDTSYVAIRADVTNALLRTRVWREDTVRRLHLYVISVWNSQNTSRRTYHTHDNSTFHCRQASKKVQETSAPPWRYIRSSLRPPRTTQNPPMWDFQYFQNTFNVKV